MILIHMKPGSSEQNRVQRIRMDGWNRVLGLFRIAAGASKLKKLKAALDCSTSQLEEFYSDPHAVAGALKSYLRELPDPLMTSQLYDEWIQASRQGAQLPAADTQDLVSDPDKRLQALWLVCDKLPKNNRNNLRYLVKFLARLAQDSETNKMTPSNMAIVLGPNLLWAKTEGSLAEMAAATSVHVVAIIEPIIQHADWFFPEDVEFNVSGMFVMPPPAASNHSSPPDADCSTDRKRSSMLGADADAARRDNSNKQPDPALRRGSSTLARKQHTSPAFQPPLPPVEAPILGPGVPHGPQAPQVDPQPPPPLGGSGLDGPQVSLVQDLVALAAAQQLLAQNTEELSVQNQNKMPAGFGPEPPADGLCSGFSLKLRDCAAAAPTPVPPKNGSGGGGPSGTGSMGPSPHTMRRDAWQDGDTPPPQGHSRGPPGRPEWLWVIERRMELVRIVSHNTHKKMVSCLQGHIGAEAEKRHSVPRLYTGNGQKKLPLTALSQAMVEGGTQLGEDSLMGWVRFRLP
ncbi:hypothetical protein CCH79_00019438 [Gambusia affinis]|uniref:Rho-GAP domain-containing protein n=1 Tax=Gambusia affinis TaxID=33528 RepID=A0A315UX58_GAMAF|nr:hypothetical protein CCH79_00019438 [Gambusia affinis]